MYRNKRWGVNDVDNASLEQWRELYDAIGNLKRLTPWEYVSSGDLIAIALEHPKTMVFCSIMGANDFCYGVSVYEGDRGLQDLNRLLTMDETGLSPNFVMAEQTCLTLYWGDREEVPPDQKSIIRQLGLKFRGSGNWPYAFSFERRYAPITPDSRGIEVLTETLKGLCMVARGFAEGRLTPQWAEGKLLARTYDSKIALWRMGWVPMPEIPNLMPVVKLTDEFLQARLKKAPRCKTKVIMDLFYFPFPVEEKRGARPYYPLFFCMLNESEHKILCIEPVELDCSEVDAVLNGFVSFVLQFGRMKQIRARNPWVLASLEQLCAMCKINLIQDALPEVDEVMAEEFDPTNI
jgi:hypothetical protein